MVTFVFTVGAARVPVLTDSAWSWKWIETAIVSHRCWHLAPVGARTTWPAAQRGVLPDAIARRFMFLFTKKLGVWWRAPPPRRLWRARRTLLCPVSHSTPHFIKGHQWFYRKKLRFYSPRRYASAVYTVVCLSVCPSVTRRYCTKMAKRKIMQTPRDSCFLTLKISATFRRRLSQRGRQTEVEWVQIGDFRPISRYISTRVSAAADRPARPEAQRMLNIPYRIVC